MSDQGLSASQSDLEIDRRILEMEEPRKVTHLLDSFTDEYLSYFDDLVL